QSLAAYRESSCVYDETASGQTYYNYFRDYDPATGRYVESDPIGLRGGINTYTYVGGNPLQSSDSFGLILLVYGDMNGAYQQARDYLDKIPEMKEIFDRLERSREVYSIIINSEHDDRFIEENNFIRWDPTSALCLRDRDGRPNGGSQTPALGLGHEAGHADGAPRGAPRLPRIPYYGNAEEQRVIEGVESIAAKILGESIRNNHGGKAKRVTSPTMRPKDCECKK
ncbi:RHS repeat-associated core domain-containing protein, partial [Undibacterium sp. 5I1]